MTIAWTKDEANWNHREERIKKNMNQKMASFYGEAQQPCTYVVDQLWQCIDIMIETSTSDWKSCLRNSTKIFDNSWNYIIYRAQRIFICFYIPVRCAYAQKSRNIQTTDQPTKPTNQSKSATTTTTKTIFFLYFIFKKKCRKKKNWDLSRITTQVAQ